MPKNKLLAHVPAEEFDRLAPYLETVDLEPRQVLVEFDHRIHYVYFLESAVTSTIVSTPNGEILEVGIMGAEGFVGLSLLYGVERSNGTVIVQIPGQALRMKTDDFLRHVKSKGGACLDVLLRYANSFQVMVQLHAACNVVHRVDERMCRWILLAHDRAGDNAFSLTQEHLSLMLGVRRATVSVIAFELKKQGMIAYKRGKLMVADRDRLEACSCECYQLIKEQMARTFRRDEAPLLET